jgi:uncharacterized protein (DUF488 family)
MIYSIGYQGFHSAAEFAQALKSYNVDLLLDVRSRPVSNFKTDFNRLALSSWLPQYGIFYEWAGDRLGGFRAIRDEALQGLTCLAKNKVICLMCMEADPDRCHRKTEISRRLETFGVEVHHLTKSGQLLADQLKIDKIDADKIRHNDF